MSVQFSRFAASVNSCWSRARRSSGTSPLHPSTKRRASLTTGLTAPREPPRHASKTKMPGPEERLLRTHFRNESAAAYQGPFGRLGTTPTGCLRPIPGLSTSFFDDLLIHPAPAPSVR